MYEESSNNITIRTFDARVMLNPVNDGIKHINIGKSALTKLGNMLRFDYQSPFECEDGKFLSLEGYWQWLRTGKQHDILREGYGYKLKDMTKKLKHLKDIPEAEFKQKIINGLKCKLKQNKPILKELISEESLPFEIYTFQNVDLNGHIVRIFRTKNRYWFLEELDIIRRLVKGESS